MKFLLASVFSCSVSAAFAGCANFTDGSLGDTRAPDYRICYDDICDVTTQEYVCSNVDSYQAGYAVGWAVDCRIADGREQDCTISWRGRAIDPAKHDRLTFEEISE
jgi:hypothetical protein